MLLADEAAIARAATMDRCDHRPGSKPQEGMGEAPAGESLAIHAEASQRVEPPADRGVLARERGVSQQPRAVARGNDEGVRRADRLLERKSPCCRACGGEPREARRPLGLAAPLLHES